MVIGQNIIKFGGLFLAIAGLFILIGKLRPKLRKRFLQNAHRRAGKLHKSDLR
jgi:hypothetical protein